MGELKRGQTVLIHGGAGGVGHMMIQIARQFGIEVITTSSSRERAVFCKSMGSGIAVVRSEQNFVDIVKESTAGRGVDVVVDCIGGPTANANLQALRIGGRYIMMGSDSGSGHVDLQKVIDKRLTITGSSLRSREPAFRNALAAVVKEKLWDMLENKVIAPRIEKVFKMSEAAKAIKLIEQGEVMGKVVCTVGGELLRADP
jgi:NADPH:quinone reductase-like Zn-dependent oxidoreductase